MFGTNSDGFTWWSNFELIQVEPHTIGQNWVPNFGTNASGILFSWRDYSSYRINTLGPLCLWQVFFVGIPVVILSAALLALSLLCLALGPHKAALLFGIALLCPAFMFRSKVGRRNKEALEVAAFSIDSQSEVLNHSQRVALGKRK